MSKRIFDVTLSALGLIILSPLLLLIAALLKLWDDGPVFYKQIRVGQNARPFFMMKFRSMVRDADRGSALTVGHDRRITPIGFVLRKFKLDELPQLWNVLKGEMSLVGPRPEVARYVESYSPKEKDVLKLKPGITDPASFAFYNESEILSQVENAEAFYTDHLIPIKIHINMEYANKSTLWTDMYLVFATVARIFGVKIDIFTALGIELPHLNTRT